MEWGISVDYVGNKSLDPKSYVGPIRQFLEGVVIVLDKLEIDTSKLSKDVPAAIKEFCSERYMICEEITAEEYMSHGGPYVIRPNTIVRHRRLPKWKIPRDLIKRVEEDGDYESERFAPLRLLVMPGTGRKSSLDWQVELDIDIYDKQYASAGEKIKAMGNEPHGDGWTELIEREFTKRYPKFAGEFDSNSETSTCVVSVKSEEACKKLVELMWSLIYG